MPHAGDNWLYLVILLIIHGVGGWVDATGIYCVKVRDAAKHPLMDKTAPHCKQLPIYSKKSLTSVYQNASSARVEKL